MITYLINADVTDGDATMQNGLISPCDAVSKAFEGRQKSVAMDMRKIVHEAKSAISCSMFFCNDLTFLAITSVVR
jgi:hypothetical protein